MEIAPQFGYVSRILGFQRSWMLTIVSMNLSANGPDGGEDFVSPDLISLNGPLTRRICPKAGKLIIGLS
jgi:hypothetical protein